MLHYSLIGLKTVCVFGLVALTVAFWLVASPAPAIDRSRDVFGFANTAGDASDARPRLQRYQARDGEELAYRFYDSASPRVLIFVHGSSYHGGGYHALAAAISGAGLAKVALPNLRGHFQSGRRRGDVDHIGQLEEDIADLAQFLRKQGHNGPITLGGHSSGGGFAIRFAGGAYAHEVSSYLLLAPVIPTSAAMRGGNAGGWASLNLRRLYGLLIFNGLGIHALDALPIIEFNKPAKFWDGTETLAYSYRLNTSYHPRYRFADDLRGLGDRAAVFVGAEDEAVDGEALRTLIAASAPKASVSVLPKVNHFGIFSDARALGAIADWVKTLPE